MMRTGIMTLAIAASLAAAADIELKLSQEGLTAKCSAPKMTVNVGWPKMTGKGESSPKVTKLADREAELVYPSGTKWIYRLSEKGEITLHPAGPRGAGDKGISHSFNFSTSVADGSTSWCLNGGETKPLPKTKLSDPFLFKNDFKSLAFTDAAGAGFRFRLPYGWAQFQDNRHWNNNQSFYFKSFSDLPQDGDYVFAFEDVKGAAVRIAAAAPLDPYAYVRYPEAKEELWPGKGPIRTFGWQEGIRKRFVERRQQDANAVFFIGDSLTENWRTMAKDLAPIKVANRGVGGDTSRGCLFRLPLEVLAHQPAAVVLAAGSNDLTAHGNPEHTLFNLKAMIDLCRKYDPRMPIFLCTLPISSQPTAPLKPGALDAVNAGIYKMCKSERCILVDRAAFVLDAEGKQDLSLFAKDRLHFGPKGYEKWTAEIKRVLSDAELAKALGDKRYAPREKLDLTGYSIAWRDEFDGKDIDWKVWDSPRQQRQGASLWDKRNVSLRDGAAVLKIRKTNDPTWRYESACLRTAKGYKPEDRLYAFTYGYVEARCKLPKWARSDYWFAVWMMVGNVMGNTDTRKGCEVDIMETFHVNHLGQMPHTIHWGGYGKQHNASGSTNFPNLTLLNDDWHTFGCLRTPTEMVFTIDGLVTWRTDLKGLGTDKDGKVKSQGVPTEPGYIKFSVEAAHWAGPNGGGWEKPMPEEDEALIDWVRVWEKK